MSPFCSFFASWISVSLSIRLLAAICQLLMLITTRQAAEADVPINCSGNLGGAFKFNLLAVLHHIPPREDIFYLGSKSSRCPSFNVISRRRGIQVEHVVPHINPISTSVGHPHHSFGAQLLTHETRASSFSVPVGVWECVCLVIKDTRCGIPILLPREEDAI